MAQFYLKTKFSHNVKMFKNLANNRTDIFIMYHHVYLCTCVLRLGVMCV